MFSQWLVAYHTHTNTSALTAVLGWLFGVFLFRIICLILKILRNVFSVFPDECKDCHDQQKSPPTAAVHPDVEAAVAEGTLKERPAEEVAARIAQQNQDEQDVVAGGHSSPLS